jgi:vanillate O-demethylase ferredoxin subunit
MKVEVTGKSDIADGICKIELAALDGQSLPPFPAGAHIDVHPGRELVRQYSLCNSPEETHRYVIAVLLEADSRGGSAAMHALAPGDALEIGLPRNLFPLAEDAEHSILLAGGIGITPILSMAHHLSASGASFEMHYGARSAERMAFRDDLRSGRFSDRVHLYHDTGPAQPRLDMAQVLSEPSAGKHLYVCGPAGFIEVVLATAAEQGWQPANVHREYFGAAPLATHDGDRTFTVKLARTGGSVEVGATESIVKALARIGVEVPVSCEQGVCGTCLTRVLDGTPEHRDSYLLDSEKAANEQILCCCSRAKSNELVLDI